MICFSSNRLFFGELSVIYFSHAAFDVTAQNSYKGSKTIVSKIIKVCTTKKDDRSVSQAATIEIKRNANKYLSGYIIEFLGNSSL